MFIAAAMHRDPQVVFQHIRDLPMRVSVIDTLGRVPERERASVSKSCLPGGGSISDA